MKRLKQATARGDRGAASVFLVVALTMIVIVALFFLIPFGSAVLDRRTASTAADAGALGAAAHWVEGLEETHALLLAADSEAEFWGVLGDPLGAYRKPGMQSEASKYALANDSNLVGYSVDATEGRVVVRVRSVEPASGTQEYVHSDATAELVFEGGLCVDGGLLGMRVDGSCQSTAPPEPSPTATPTPSPSATDEEGAPSEPEPTPTPSPTFDLPEGLEADFGVRTRLTGS